MAQLGRFNRWLESDIMCFFYVLANYLGCYVLFTVFVVIRGELENSIWTDKGWKPNAFIVV